VTQFFYPQYQNATKIFYPQDVILLFGGVGPLVEVSSRSWMPFLYDERQKFKPLMKTNHWEKPLKKFKKGLIEGTLMVVVRAICRIIAIRLYDCTVESILEYRVDLGLKKIRNGFYKYVLRNENISNVSVNAAAHDSKMINIYRGYEKGLEGFASRTFLQFSKTIVQVFYTLYQLKTGKDDDDSNLIMQKTISGIFYSIGEIIGYTILNGLIFSLVEKNHKIIWLIVLYILDSLFVSQFASHIRIIAENHLPFLDRVSGGKLKVQRLT